MTAPDATQDGELYEARQKIYPREIEGRFQRLRTLAAWVLLGIFYVIPWIPWSGRQAVLFDLPARKFHIFGLTLWPQDFYFLTWLLVIAALSLFFFTALAGRLFCGYACPQTVWTETFLWMERFVEGSRSQQMKLARAPWTAEKILRKGAKQFLWIAFALWTGFTFVGYFTPIAELAGKIANFATGPWETFWVLFYGGATYVNAGFMREQVCKYMCPYARFQSAMFDRDTLIITYDETRGEPRGARKKGVDHRAKGLGDCVDCTLCVQVCPTGIDIRKGLQYECIACAACIDACDEVMDKVGYPRGLIRYDTQHGLEGKAKKVLRPRTIVYASLLALLVTGFAVTLSNRSVVAVDVIRDRNALFRERSDGRIENVYNVKILNKDREAHEFRIAASGVPGLEVDYAGPTVWVAPGAVQGVPVRIRVPRGSLQGGADLVVGIEAVNRPDLKASGQARFIAPTD
jgi:cytochrome c oxidase accessory protein FixG